MEVLQTSALPLGYGAATHDPSGSTFRTIASSSRRTRGTIESNDTLAREQVCLHAKPPTRPFLKPSDGQSQRDRQAERPSHDSRQARAP